ncbi:MAG: dicarboxylate/amino acid:cation symporter [Agathobacter sp.]|nr:dicarboxylate/amino acid:cation symporter [Agathobacter sp.]
MKKNKHMSLSTKIFIALIAGAVFGLLINFFLPTGLLKDTILIHGILYVIGNGFIRLMQMLVIPLVISSLICGTMSIGDTKTLGQVGIKTLVFYTITTALAITIALALGMFIRPGMGLNITSVEIEDVTVNESVSMADTILNIIPKNVIASMAEGDMLPIIFFSVFLGILLAKLGSKTATISRFFAELNDVMMEMTITVMKAAPIGVFCMIARTIASIGFDAFVPMLKYVGGVIFALALQCFGIYLLLLFAFTRLNPFTFIKKYFPVMEFAFSTSSSNATIPISIETLKEKLGVSSKISSFTVPLGATINMDGTAIMQGVAVVFIADAYGIELTGGMLATVIATATLASIGTAGVPGVGLITLAMVLTSVGLPTEGIALIMGIDRIIDMLRTAVNVTGDAVCTTVVAHQAGMVDKEVFYSTNDLK